MKPTQYVSCRLTGLCLITPLDMALTSDHWVTVSDDVLVVLWTDEVGPQVLSEVALPSSDSE